QRADVAQLVEQPIRNRQVTSSSLVVGSILRPPACSHSDCASGGNVRKLFGFVVLCVVMSFAAGKSVYDFPLNTIDGQPTSLAAYKGKVLLVVNVASRCGFTPQYSALESTYEKYMDRGLVIVGVPANNFGAQEPGTNQEIKTFCTRKYNVQFPMMSKVSVKGSDTTPLYQ